MVQIQCDLSHAPLIGLELSDTIDKLTNPEDYVLSMQLDYREENTIFYLNTVSLIEFGPEMLKITLRNGSVLFYYYENILEYYIINSKSIKGGGKS